MLMRLAQTAAPPRRRCLRNTLARDGAAPVHNRADAAAAPPRGAPSRVARRARALFRRPARCYLRPSARTARIQPAGARSGHRRAAPPTRRAVGVAARRRTLGWRKVDATGSTPHGRGPPRHPPPGGEGRGPFGARARRRAGGGTTRPWPRRGAQAAGGR